MVNLNSFVRILTSKADFVSFIFLVAQMIVERYSCICILHCFHHVPKFVNVVIVFIVWYQFIDEDIIYYKRID